MAKERKSKVNLSRLCGSMRASRKMLEPFRVTRREAARKYAGPEWSIETVGLEDRRTDVHRAVHAHWQLITLCLPRSGSNELKQYQSSDHSMSELPHCARADFEKAPSSR
jgi:hypothetical protein